MSGCCWCTWTLYILAGISAVSFLTYLIPYIFDALFCSEQNLKKKYNAEWAVVTGASSGIGRALTKKLAQQGINVVMVATDDDLLKNTHKQMQLDFPSLSFRKVPCNLGVTGYMELIKEATKDIQPNLIFNNAGYVATGHFADQTLERSLCNYECNATSPMIITHHFANRMLDANQKGAIFFTSSPAGMMACPITVMYGATKAFLTEFAVSIAAELRVDGIDVLVVHPSPVNTGFYSGNNHNISAMSFFQRTACSPETVASTYFESIGKTIIRDQGYYPVLLKTVLKIFDFNALAWIISRTASTSADFFKSKKQRNNKDKKM